MTLPRFLVALVLAALAVRAAAADDAAMGSARRHFERGQKLYALAKFGEALDEYQKAFDAAPLPDLLFNIGQCYRNLGDYDSAIFSFRKYLTLAPDASNREQVEALIAQLQTQKDQSDTHRLGLQPPPERVAAAPQHVDRPFYKAWWFWTGIGTAVAVGGGVTIYEVTRPHGPPSTDLGNIVFGK